MIFKEKVHYDCSLLKMLLMNFKMQRKYFFQIDEEIRQILTNEAETFQSSWIGLSVKMIIRGTGIGLFVPFFWYLSEMPKYRKYYRHCSSSKHTLSAVICSNFVWAQESLCQSDLKLKFKEPWKTHCKSNMIHV